jgi:hypothetical protein
MRNAEREMCDTADCLLNSKVKSVHNYGLFKAQTELKIITFIDHNGAQIDITCSFIDFVLHKCVIVRISWPSIDS